MAAADTARLIAQLVLDDKQFQAAIGRSISGTQKLESTLSKVGGRASKGLGETAKNLERIAAIGAIGAVGLLAKSVSLASDLNEQLNKTKVVFGDASKAVIAFSETTADGIGISQAEALTAAGNFGNMFKTVGLADAVAGDFSTTLVTLAADMASFNDEDPSEMLDRLRSGLSGEAEPLRRFGVLISAARVEEEAYAEGIAKRGEALTEAQKVQARYSLILKDTAIQQGDFARTNESFANLMRRIKGSLRDAGATIGTALLPKVTELALKFNTLIQDNGPAIQKFADQLPAAFDKALAFAEKIPWETIGKGMEQAAFFTGKLIDAFLAMPPEVQGTLIALAGLNKLSGGAITGIVGELGKGLIKGVLGINAGHVTVNAATVSGVGGVPGVGGAPGGGTGGAVRRAAGEAFKLIIPVAVALELAKGVARELGANVPDQGLGPLDAIIVKHTGNDKTNKHLQDVIAAAREQKSLSQQQAFAIRDATAQGAEKNRQAAFAIRDKVAGVGSLTVGAINAVKAVAAQTTAAARAAGQQAAFAIRDKDLSVAVQNTINTTTVVSVRETIKSTTTHKQYARYLS